jgi:hypothetical protein
MNDSSCSYVALEWYQTIPEHAQALVSGYSRQLAHTETYLSLRSSIEYRLRLHSKFASHFLCAVSLTYCSLYFVDSASGHVCSIALALSALRTHVRRQFHMNTCLQLSWSSIGKHARQILRLPPDCATTMGFVCMKWLMDRQSAWCRGDWDSRNVWVSASTTWIIMCLPVDFSIGFRQSIIGTVLHSRHLPIAFSHQSLLST